MKRYRMLSRAIGARKNCQESGNHDWCEKWEDLILSTVKNDFPAGSGIDSGCTIDLDKSTSEKIIINTSFHHMNDGGMYDGWTDHTITVIPSLQFDFTLKISGRDRNDIKEYLADMFQTVLSENIETEGK